MQRQRKGQSHQGRCRGNTAEVEAEIEVKPEVEAEGEVGKNLLTLLLMPQINLRHHINVCFVERQITCLLFVALILHLLLEFRHLLTCMVPLRAKNVYMLYTVVHVCSVMKKHAIQRTSMAQVRAQ